MFARLRARIVLGVLAALCLLACPAQASAAQTRERGIEWQPCNERFQCATVRVPLDYDRPRSGKIAIALARLPASDPSRRIGSLFLNPGGPGGSGVDYLFGLGPSCTRMRCGPGSIWSASTRAASSAAPRCGVSTLRRNGRRTSRPSPSR